MACCCDDSLPRCQLECPGTPIPLRLYLTLTYVSGPSDCMDGYIFELNFASFGEGWVMDFQEIDGCVVVGANYAFQFRCVFPGGLCGDPAQTLELQHNCPGGLPRVVCSGDIVCDPLTITYPGIEVAGVCLDGGSVSSFYDGVITG